MIKLYNKTRGSGKKPFAQKGTGRARQGNKRAPGHWKGGKAHGPKPRDHSYPLCKKVRLQGSFFIYINGLFFKLSKKKP